jgi:hypothetical protein
MRHRIGGASKRQAFYQDGLRPGGSEALLVAVT